MSAVDERFARLRAAGQKALLPFITAGDPDIATTERVVRALAGAGADICEIGVPYSDPIADGPVIQASYQRALERGFRLQELFDLGRALTSPVGSGGRAVFKLHGLEGLHHSPHGRVEPQARRGVDASGPSPLVPRDPPEKDGTVTQDGTDDKPHDLSAAGESLPPVDVPMITMVSYSIIQRLGLEAYVRRAQEAGYSGAIVPDLLVEEAEDVVRVCRAADFSLVQLVTPTTPRDRQLRIADVCSGFLYVVSVTGITGERRELSPALLENLAWLREQTPLPICVGFGISGPDQARQLAPLADGLIVGSAFVRRMSAGGDDREAMLRDITAFARQLIDAMRESSPA